MPLHVPPRPHARGVVIPDSRRSCPGARRNLAALSAKPRMLLAPADGSLSFPPSQSCGCSLGSRSTRGRKCMSASSTLERPPPLRHRQARASGRPRRRGGTIKIPPGKRRYLEGMKERQHWVYGDGGRRGERVGWGTTDAAVVGDRLVIVPPPPGS